MQGTNVSDQRTAKEGVSRLPTNLPKEIPMRQSSFNQMDCALEIVGIIALPCRKTSISNGLFGNPAMSNAVIFSSSCKVFADQMSKIRAPVQISEHCPSGMSTSNTTNQVRIHSVDSRGPQSRSYLRGQKYSTQETAIHKFPRISLEDASTQGEERGIH